MSAQTTLSKIKQQTNRPGFIRRLIRTIEERAASLMLLFDERDFFNSDKLTTKCLIALEYLVLIAYCFSQNSIQDWHANHWTLQIAMAIQFFDPSSHFAFLFSYEGFVILLGFLMAVFAVILYILIQAVRSHGAHGVWVSASRTIARFSAPLLLVYFQSPFLRMLVNIVISKG